MSTLEERYGTSGPVRNKGVVALAVLVVAAALSWLAWAMLEQGRPDAQSALVGFEADGPHAAVATFDVVRRDADVKASCLLRAFSADHATVGEANVVVGPGDSKGPAYNVWDRPRRRNTNNVSDAPRKSGVRGRADVVGNSERPFSAAGFRRPCASTRPR